MEDKRSSTRTKRQKAPDEGYWDCSVCTFRNSPEAYKCEMCDVRKGTSTRKPRLNPQLVAAQVAQQFAPPATKKERSSTAHASHNGTRHNGEDSDSRESTRSSNRRYRWPRLKNVDRSSGTQMAVTVGNLTVIITDYKPKNTNSSSASSASSENQIHSDTSDTNSSYAGNDHDPNDDSPAEGAGN